MNCFAGDPKEARSLVAAGWWRVGSGGLGPLVWGLGSVWLSVLFVEVYDYASALPARWAAPRTGNTPPLIRLICRSPVPARRSPPTAAGDKRRGGGPRPEVTQLPAKLASVICPSGQTRRRHGYRQAACAA